MSDAVLDKGEVLARRSLVPQTETIALTAEALPPDVRERFKRILSAYLDAHDDEERVEIGFGAEEILDPDGTINVNAVSIDSWMSDRPEVLDIESRLSEKKSRFAERVASRMRSESLTQKALADKLKVTPSTVSQIVSGRHKPQPETLARLAEALNCKSEDLWPADDQL